jgi:signal transduction histidine kinase/AraC-like DNA-binding protein/CheY-like chemotaxis protein
MSRSQFLLLCCALLLKLPVEAQKRHSIFQHYTIESGLSHSHVNCIQQDLIGFIWVGTNNGLNRFDGYSFKQYNSKTACGLQSDVILHLATDADGEMWVLTDNTFYHYNTRNDHFNPIPLFNDGRRIANDVLFSLHQTTLLMVQQDTLYEWHQNKGAPQVWDLKRRLALPATAIGESYCIADVEQEIWLGGSTGLNKWDRNNNFVEVHSIKEPVYQIWHDDLHGQSIVQSASQLSVFQNQERIYQTASAGQNNQKIVGNKWKYGYLVINQNQVQYWDGLHLKATELTFDRSISASFTDRAGNRWFGLEAYGLIGVKEQPTLVEQTFRKNNVAIYPPIFNSNQQLGLFCPLEHSNISKLGYYQFLDPTTGKEMGRLPPCFYATSTPKGDIWYINTHRKLTHHPSGKVIPSIGGIERLNINAGVNALPDGSLLLISEDAESLCFFQPTTGQTLVLNHLQKQFHLTDAWDVSNVFTKQSASGWAWITLPQKLIGLFPNWTKGQIDLKSLEPSSFPDLLNDKARFIFAEGDFDNSEYVWIGTWDGLFRWEIEKNQLEKISLRQLNHDAFFCMLQQNGTDSWVGGKNGLVQLNKKTMAITIFTTAHGFPSNEFNRNTTAILPNGKMLVGTTGGWSIFTPQLEVLNRSSSQMAITSVSNGSQSFPPTRFNYQYQLSDLAATTENLNVQFTLLNTTYAAPPQYRFRFIDKDSSDWIYNGINNSLVLYHLLPGKYLLEIQGSSNGRDWSPPIFLYFKILPHWWNTIWFYSLLLLLTAVIIYFIAQQRKRWLQEKHRRELFELEAVHQKELIHSQERLLANVAHDLRTPLALITGTAQKMREQPIETVYKAAELIKHQGFELLELINQILQFGALREHANIPLYPQIINLQEEVPILLSGFSFQAEEKSIQFSIKTSPDLEPIWIDKAGLKTVLSNVLSNAIKYTPNGGQILLQIQTVEDNLSFQIEDSGPGVSSDYAAKIFERFFKGPSSEGSGFGIGLAFASEMAAQLGGLLYLDKPSTTLNGACFVLQIPSAKIKIPDTARIHPQKILPNFPAAELQLIVDGTRPHVIVVEDHPEMATYIQSLLVSFCDVDIARDGQEGWDLIVSSIPDLIISDLIMPKMNGAALSERLRSDIRTSHIPLIIISGSTSEASLQTSLNNGANLYLNKPFDAHVLQQYVINSLQVTQRTKSFFQELWGKQHSSTNLPIQPDGLSTVQEGRFIDNVESLIAKHYQQDDFSVDKLASMLHISQSQLRRKVLALGGNSPGNMIRQYRLTKAKQLIEQSKEMSMSDIAFACGFTDPNYFSTAFGKEFGITPKQYRLSLDN